MQSRLANFCVYSVCVCICVYTAWVGKRLGHSGCGRNREGVWRKRRNCCLSTTTSTALATGRNTTSSRQFHTLTHINRENIMTELTVIGCVLTSSCKMSYHSKDDKESFGLNPDWWLWFYCIGMKTMKGIIGVKPFICVGLDYGSNTSTLLLWLPQICTTFWLKTERLATCKQWLILLNQIKRNVTHQNPVRTLSSRATK